MPTTCINGVPQVERDALVLTASGTSSGTTRVTLAEIEMRPSSAMFVECEIVSAKAGCAKSRTFTWREAFRRVGTGAVEASVSAEGLALADTNDNAGSALLPKLEAMTGGNSSKLRLTVGGIAAETWKHAAVITARESREA